MPIQELIKILSIRIPNEVKKAIEGLVVNPMYLVSLGIKGEDKNKFTALYFPEEDFLPNRICFPKTFSEYNAPSDSYSIQADITCSKDSAIWKKSDDEILKEVKDGLKRKGILAKNSEIVYENVRRTKYSYVVYDKKYEKNVRIIRSWFPSQGIHLVGRFSYFEYINIDAAVKRALEFASLINGGPATLSNGEIKK